MITKDQEARCQAIWDLAIKDCLAEGVNLGDAVGFMLQCNAGSLKALVGTSAARKEILRLREDVWTEFTLLADRCGPGS